ncbi:zinc-binding dehydrogenase [Embleya sp. NPDC127516]|uniref:zinc-binding dehydrogenase n=1 Tax=Embleya sp. NPDC127516 TaxID=3363990 RepID=UPI0038278878
MTRARPGARPAGTGAGGSAHASPGGQHYLGEVLDMAAKGKVKPITETFPLDRATDAYDRLVSGKMRFRGVFTPQNS